MFYSAIKIKLQKYYKIVSFSNNIVIISKYNTIIIEFFIIIIIIMIISFIIIYPFIVQILYYQIEK